MTIVYVDMTFVINGMVNYLLLVTTGHLAGVRLHRIRLLFGSLLGACYSVIVYLPGAAFLQQIPCKIGVAVLMLLIGYGGVNRFLRLSFLFFAVSFAFSGSMLALECLRDRNLIQNDGWSVSAGIEELLLAIAFCYLVLSIVFRRSAKHGGIRRDIVQIRARCGEREADFFALMDSGNTLTDPITNAPVIVAELEAATALLTEEQKAILTAEMIQDAPLALEHLSELGDHRFFLIPYRAVGVSSGLLLTLRTDAVFLNGKRYHDILIAFSPTSVSDGGGYAALVGNLEDYQDSVAFGSKRRKKREAVHETKTSF